MRQICLFRHQLRFLGDVFGGDEGDVGMLLEEAAREHRSYRAEEGVSQDLSLPEPIQIHINLFAFQYDESGDTILNLGR